jgi:hypothetical protein
MLSKGNGFFPFSPAFMGEMFSDSENEQDYPLASNNDNEDLPNKESTTKETLQSERQSSSPSNNSKEQLSIVTIIAKLKYFIGIPNSGILHLSGFGKMKLIFGTFVLNGYTLQNNEEVSFNCPIWQPTLRAYVSKSIGNLNTSSSCLEVPKKLFDSIQQSCVCAIMIEGIPREDQEWITAIELQDSYLIPLPKKELPGKNTLHRDELLKFSSGCLGTADALTGLGIQLTHLPSSWSHAANDIITKSIQECDDTKIMICGAKGVGKSSLTRYLIHRFLSESSTTDMICYLNCDLGQPEFTAPGFLSLHIVQQPLFSAAHYHISTDPDQGHNCAQTVAMHFMGDVTSRHEPSLFLEALQAILTQYQALVAVQQGKQRVHLLINTDGFIRYMGAEILSAIFHTIQPTHVLHIQSQKDPHSPFAASQRQHVYLAVEAGRHVPCRVKASDLRYLRLAVYFLRFHPFLAASQLEPRPMPLQTVSSAGARARPGSRKDLLDDVSVRTANLTGGDRGSLAMALLSLAPLLIPLDKVVFNQMSGAHDLPVHMLLAAANANLVSIAVLARDELDPVQTAHLHSSDARATSLCIQSTPTVWSRPCLGLGLVRAVNLVKQHLVLTTPIHPAQLGGQWLLLTLSTSAIKLPIAMLCGNSFPVFPYMTGEVAGEGAQALRTRPNKRRRGQQSS